METLPRRRIGLAVILTLALTIPSFGQKTPKKGDGESRSLEQVRNSVAMIWGPHGHGSGFVVGSNVIATNAHVIRDNLMKDIKVVFVSNSGQRSQELQPQLLFEDKGMDLALLYVPNLDDHEPLALASNFEPGRNKKVYVVGSPGQPVKGVARVNTIAEGVADEIVAVDKQYLVQVKVSNSDEQINAGQGNSGGPVVDPAGRVIGVTVSGVMIQNSKTRELRSGNTLFCIPAHELQTILSQLGSSTQWNERIELATARHALDISVVQLYLNAKIAREIFELRCELDGSARSGIAQTYYQSHKVKIARVTLEVDRVIVDHYKSFDQHARSLILPALQQLSSSNKLLSAETSRNLRSMRNAINQIRVIAMKESFTSFEAQQCVEQLKVCEACFQKLKARTGLTDELIAEMVSHAVHALNSKLDKHTLNGRR